jgi:hypothetical protein
VSTPKLGPVAAARVALEAKQAATAKAAADLEAARREEQARIDAHAADRTKARRADRLDSLVTREACERDHAKAIEAEERARKVYEAEDLRDRIARYEARVTFVCELPTRLPIVVARVDRAIAELRAAQDAAADLVLDAQAAFAEAVTLAESLNRREDLRARASNPSLADVRHLVRVRNGRQGELLDPGWADAESEPHYGAIDRPAFDEAIKKLEASHVV